jgi:hypothetical protein
MSKKPTHLKHQISMAKKQEQQPLPPPLPAVPVVTAAPPVALPEPVKSGILLDLVIARNTGEHDIYLVDAIDLSNLVGPADFIEIPTKRTPGIRFITIRYHNGK